MRRSSLVPLLFMAGIVAGLFFSVPALAEDFVSSLEAIPLNCWDVYPNGHHKDTSYVTDCDTDRAEFIVIFSDGIVYAGKNRVRLSKAQRRRVKRLYRKIRKYKKRRCGRCYNTL